MTTRSTGQKKGGNGHSNALAFYEVLSRLDFLNRETRHFDGVSVCLKLNCTGCSLPPIFKSVKHFFALLFEKTKKIEQYNKIFEHYKNAVTH